MPRDAAPIVLWTQLTPDECRARMETKVASFADWLSYKELSGSVEPGQFRVQRRTPFFRNDFRPSVEGRVTRVRDATRIELRTRTHGAPIAFIVAWFGFLGGFWLFGLLMFLTARYKESIAFVVLPPAMAAFAFAALRISTAMSAHEKDEILDIVRRTLDAHEATERVDVPRAGYRDAATRAQPLT